MKSILYSSVLAIAVGLSTMAQTPSTDQNYVQSQTFRGSASSLPVTTVDYVDGLGRPVQSVIHQGSPTGQDVVSQTIGYDAQGRQDKVYLPVAVPTQSGAFFTGIASQASSFYGDAAPFTQALYEASPLNRVSEQYGAGEAWHAANRSVKSTFAINTSNQVRVWEVPFNGTLVSTGFYSAGELYKTIMTDEENHQVIEYKDKQGQVVEKRVQDGGTAANPTWMVTCYVYDAMQRLAYVVPPKLYAAKVETVSGTITLSEQTDQELLFAYHYDGRGRVTEKLVPGGGWTQMVYNKLDQLILSQNARQAAESKWTFSKYDAFGRVVVSGEKQLPGQSRAQLQADADLVTVQFEQRGQGVFDYTNVAYPAVSELEVNLVNYYDAYNWNTAGIGFVAFDNLTEQTARGLATGSKVRLLDGSHTILTSVNYYDGKNRLIQTHQQNPFGGVTRTDLSLSFAGEVLTKRVVNHYNDAKPNYTTLTAYDYDHIGRKIRTRHAILTPAQTPAQAQWITLAEYDYDQIGRLKSKRIQPSEQGYLSTDALPASKVRNQPISGDVTDQVTTEIVLGEGFAMSEGSTYIGQVVSGSAGGSTVTQALQTMDYAYNIRGWLRSINNGTLNASENDLFAFKLSYQEEAGGYYNGNIHKQSWLSHSVKDSPARGYTYSYDAANRLTAAQYTGGKYAGENYSLQGMQYDKNGNILALTRSGMVGGTPTSPTQFGAIDQLSYSYQNNGQSNKLAAVTDAITATIADATGDFKDKNTQGDDYDYCPDGSLKEDKNKGIQSIVYNYLGLVQTEVLPKTWTRVLIKKCVGLLP